MNATVARARITVVDDDAEIVAAVRILLGRQGFEVSTINERFNRVNQLAELAPDLILLDVNMPFVPGDELHALLKQHPLLRGVPVVFFSSNDERELRQLARASGAAGYIPKSDLGGAFADRVARFLPALSQA